MRKHLYVTMLLLAGFLSGSYTAMAAPEPQQQGQTVTTITGTVLDENNEAVIGASVVQKGASRNAAATDAFGHFTLRVPAGAVLQVSYVGYKTAEVRAANDMTVYLQPSTEMLNELVAIGYGSQKRANLTGAVATVDVARTMDSRSTTDVTKALQGAVPGLTITNSNGDINGTPKVTIRGTGTLTTQNQTSTPLYVVDGIVVEDISYLNPNDIADISVLKDAASAAVYGTRAAFGVILITTKTPNQKDRVSVNYNNNFGWSQATTLPEYPTVPEQLIALTEGNLCTGGEIGLFGMDPFEMLPLAQQWIKENGGKRAGYRPMVLYQDDNHVGDYKMVNGNGLYYADWDVAGIMFNNATPSNYHNVSVEGASGKTNYRLSFGYDKKQDLMKFNPATMKRYNAVANINTEIFSWWKAGVRFSFTEKDYAGPYNVRGDYLYMWRWGSYFGPYGYWTGEDGEIIDARNDIAYRKQSGNYDDRITDTRVTAYSDFNLFKGFNLHADFSYDVQNYLQTVPYMPVYCYNTWGNIEQPGYDAVPVSYADARQTNTKSDTWMMNVFGTYQFSLKDAFNFKVMLGATAEKNDYNYIYGKRDELLDLSKPWLGLTTGGADQTGYTLEQSITHWATAGFFGRVNFDYKGIYLLELNGRYDGSTRFPAANSWAFFPSASAGYRFSEESYFEPVKGWWSNGKIRASYGEVGNTAVTNNANKYRFLSTIGTPTTMAWLTGANAKTPYANMPTLVSSTLTWERVRTIDAGLDLGFMNNSLNIGFDWYTRETSDMLCPGASLPATLGASAPYGNNGAIRTNGWELSVNWNHSFGEADVFATFNIGDARTKITKWKNEAGVLYSWAAQQTNFTEGGYYGDIYGFETDRYFEKNDINPATGKPFQDQSALESDSFTYGVGDIMFKDLDGDGKITFGDPKMKDEDGNLIPIGTQRNHGDLKVIGNAMPRYEYSFRLGGAWKGFDLDIFFQGVGKREMWYTSAFVVPFARGTDALYAHQTSYNEQVIDMNTHMLTGEIIVDQNNKYPRLYPGSGGTGRLSSIGAGKFNFYPQSKYLMNMAYLRLKALTVGYTLPADITRKALIQKARVYFSADNLALLYNGMKDYPLDPEISTAGTGMHATTGMNGANGNGYFGRTTPMPRTYSFGIQLTF